MVEVKLRIRQMNGYHYSNKIDTITLDSSSRLEELLLKSKTGGATSNRASLYRHNGQELPLNSSIASHNLEEYEIIESCRNPYISAALSSLMKDMEYVKKKIPCEERGSKERLVQVFQFPDYVLEGEGEDIYSFLFHVKEWEQSKIERRTICCANMKKTIQRDDRNSELSKLKHCRTIQEFHTDMQRVWTSENRSGGRGRGRGGGRGRGRGRNGTGATATDTEPTLSNSTLPAHTLRFMFSSKTKKTGKASTIYILLEKKLQIQNEIKRNSNNEYQNRNRPDYVDPLEEFLRLDEARHARLNEGMMNNGDNTTATTATAVSSTSGTRRRRRNTTTTSNSNDNNTPTTTTTSTSATSTAANNRTSPSAASTSTTTIRRSKHYCPEYASGPFAVLSTLYEAMHPSEFPNPTTTRHQRPQRRELSLTESRLKHNAQRRCRSNLYDRNLGYGTKNAFACMEGLINRELVRKEQGDFGIEENYGDTNEKWMLLPNGEEMARDCLSFEQAMDHVLPKSLLKNVPEQHQQQQQQLHRSDSNDLILIVDNREDPLYRERLKWYFEDDNIPYEEREVPAGDYLFITKDEKVVPLVIERKTWSDLADSVMCRKGKAHRRLECVKINSIISANSTIEDQQRSWQQKPQCEKKNCQLCKMKRSGCTQILFIIEGGWCSNKDNGGHRNQKKCMPEKRCQSCKTLMDRHEGMTHEILEKVLHRLQVQHGCHIHFTNDYNETITSLRIIREFLMEGNDFASLAFEKSGKNDDLNISNNRTCSLTYDTFSSNARKTSATPVYSFNRKKQDVIDWTVQCFASNIISGGTSWRNSVYEKIVGCPLSSIQDRNGLVPRKSVSAHKETHGQKRQRVDETNNGIIRLDLSDDDEDNNVMYRQKRRKVDRPANGVITLDLSDDDDENNNNMVDLVDTVLKTDSSNPINMLSEIIEIPDSQEPETFEIIEIEDSQQSMIKMDDDSDSDGTIECLEEASINEPTTSTTQAACSSQGLGNNSVTPISSQEFLEASPMVILRQMQYYNDTFMKEINKIWKDTHNLKMTRASQEDQNESYLNILDHSIDGIEALKIKDFPFLRRETFLYATLYVQIKLGVIFRIASRNQYADDLKQLWAQNSVVTRDVRSCNSSNDQSQVLGSSRVTLDDRSHPCEPPTREQTPRESMQPPTGTSTNSHTSSRAKKRKSQVDASVRTTSVSSTATQGINGSVKSLYTNPIPNALKSENNLSRLPPQKAKLIEARLRRFQSGDDSRVVNTRNTSTSLTPSIAEHKSKWNCDYCTFENSTDALVCVVCNIARAGSETHLQQMQSLSSPLPVKSTIIASQESMIDSDAFGDAFAPNEAQLQFTSENITGMSNPARGDSVKNGPTSRVIKCGACGRTGHNRSNANEDNCSAFNDEAEREKREEKWRKKQEKAILAEQEYKDFQAQKQIHDTQSERRAREIQRIAEDHMKDKERYSALMDAELKQKEKAAKRAARAARR